MVVSSAIGSARRKFWEGYGFLVFPGFFSDEEVDAVRAAYDRTWEAMPSWVVVEDLLTNCRCRITDLSDAEKRHHFKVNDLYLLESDVRNIALSGLLGLILEDLLGDEPIICNSLNFDKGSQQIDHWLWRTLMLTPALCGTTRAATTSSLSAFPPAPCTSTSPRFRNGRNTWPTRWTSWGSTNIASRRSGATFSSARLAAPRR